MTETEWLACTNLSLLRQFLARQSQFRLSERKLRLFGCACCHRLKDLLTDESSREALRIAELYADGELTWKELSAARKAAESSYRTIRYHRTTGNFSVVRATAFVSKRNGIEAGWTSSSEAASILGCEEYEATHRSERYDYETWLGAIYQEASRQAVLLHDILGNVFHPASILPDWLRWNDNTIPTLARTIYVDRAFDRMPILADALEEAGCTDSTILEHCRSLGPHVRGCWVVDLLIDKQ